MIPGCGMDVRRHMLIEGLFDELPPVGAEWADEQRQAWIEALLAAFNVLYTRAAIKARETTK